MLYIDLNYFNFICMQDLNSFRIVGTIKNLIIQEEDPAIPMHFDLITIDGAIFKIYVNHSVYKNNSFSGGLVSTLVECSGRFEMIKNSVTLSLNKMIQIECKDLVNPF